MECTAKKCTSTWEEKNTQKTPIINPSHKLRSINTGLSDAEVLKTENKAGVKRKWKLIFIFRSANIRPVN